QDKEQEQEVGLVMGIESVPISVSKCRSKMSNIDVQLFRADQALSAVEHLTALLGEQQRRCVAQELFLELIISRSGDVEMNNKQQLEKRLNRFVHKGKSILVSVRSSKSEYVAIKQFYNGNEFEFIRETLILQRIGKGHQKSDLVTVPRTIGAIPQLRIRITSTCGMILEEFEQAHINGWWHRDASPSNFVIVNNNEIGSKQTSDKKRLCIIDWGIAVECSIGGGIVRCLRGKVSAANDSEHEQLLCRNEFMILIPQFDFE
ncbi:MAG: hypothetical protein EZS28_049665, partial [Streblomastix strix]